MANNRNKLMKSDNSSERPMMSFLDSPWARLLGFIADTIAILSSIFAVISLVSFDQLGHPNSNFIFTDIPIPAFFPHVLLGFVIYSYLAILHNYWQKHLRTEKLPSRFSLFLKNILLKFSHPWLLFPILFFAIIYAYIVINSVGEETKSLLMSIFIFGVIVYFITAEKPNPKNSFRKRVDKDWDKWKTTIENELSKTGKIQASDLKAWASVFDVEVREMEYILTKYADENPQDVEYILFPRRDS